MQIRKDGASLLLTRRDHRPNPFAPPIPRSAPRPLCRDPIEHDEPDRLFRQVVRWFDPRCCDEPEITRPMLLTPLRHVATRLRRRHILGPTPYHLLPRRYQLTLERRRRHLLSLV